MVRTIQPVRLVCNVERDELTKMRSSGTDVDTRIEGARVLYFLSKGSALLREWDIQGGINCAEFQQCPDTFETPE